MKKRILAIALSLTLLGGCTPSEVLPVEKPSDAASSEQIEPGYFGLAYYAGEAVNPILARSRVNRLLIEAMYEGLFQLDNNFAPQPVLCESYAHEGATYTFSIKKGVKFWSGAPLMADDVVYSYQLAQKTEESPYHERFSEVTSIKATGDHEVKISLREENANLPALLDVPIFRRGTETDTFSDGTGVFRPQSVDGETTLVPFENWHGGRETAIHSIALISTVRADAAAYSFETGDVSMTLTDRLSPSAVSVTGAVKVYLAPTTAMHYLGINHRRAAFSVAKVRQGLSLLLDRNSLCLVQLQDAATPAILPINPQPEGTSTAQDRDKATDLLEHAGILDTNGDGKLDWSPIDINGLDEGMIAEAKHEANRLFGYRTDGKRAVFAPEILVCSDNSFKVAAAEQIAVALQTAGIGATVRELAYEEYEKALSKGDFDLYYAETMLSPDFNLKPLLAPDGALNFGQVGTDALAQSLQSARASGDYDAFWKVFSELQPIIPLAFKKNQIVVRAGAMEEFSPAPFNAFADAVKWEAVTK